MGNLYSIESRARQRVLGIESIVRENTRVSKNDYRHTKKWRLVSPLKWRGPTVRVCGETAKERKKVEKKRNKDVVASSGGSSP
jgi:hypothetical protein